MTTMNTLALAQDTWDLITDINGNIGMASPPYAVAQDVASAVRTFTGDLWYNANTGIPYLNRIFGRSPSVQYLRSQVEAAALTVPGVVKARCLFAQIENRTLRGQVQVIDETGAKNNVSF